MIVYIETYGCQMNVSDSELMAGILRESGHQLSDRAENAEAIFVNTCAIRDNAEEKVVNRLQQLNYMKRKKPELILGVCGCMAQHMKNRIAQIAPFVDILLGPDAYRSLPQAIETARSDAFVNLKLDKNEDYSDIIPIRKDGIRAWLTIQRGCDKMCTFCVVPFTRGRERSIPLPMLIDEARRLSDGGFKEIVLLGQTVNSYHDGKNNFGELLFALNEIETLERIRFTSPHPSDATEPLIEAMASCDKVCKHIHLPLQSASDRILEKMHRTYNIAEYRKLMETLRHRIPDISISTDLIVGFCGETEKDFQKTYDFVAEEKFSTAFMFKYSDREGTIANRKLDDDVPESEKKRRLQAVIELQTEISRELNQRFLGKVVEVLVEGESRRSTEDFHGKSDGFRTVVFPRGNYEIGDRAKIRIRSATSHTLIGEPIES